VKGMILLWIDIDADRSNISDLSLILLWTRLFEIVDLVLGSNCGITLSLCLSLRSKTIFVDELSTVALVELDNRTRFKLMTKPEQLTN
jgi:hypothetical protein